MQCSELFQCTDAMFRVVNVPQCADAVFRVASVHRCKLLSENIVQKMKKKTSRIRVADFRKMKNKNVIFFTGLHTAPHRGGGVGGWLAGWLAPTLWHLICTVLALLKEKVFPGGRGPWQIWGGRGPGP